MIVLRVDCINIHGLELSWEQGHLLNDLRWLNLYVIAASGIGISDTRILTRIYDNFEIFTSPSRPGMGWGVSVVQKRPRSRDTVDLP